MPLLPMTEEDAACDGSRAAPAGEKQQLQEGAAKIFFTTEKQ